MNVLTAVLNVFEEVAEWIGTAITSLIPIFWAEGTGLTFMGVLAVAGLAFSVILLVFSIIQNFLHFRG